MHKLSLRAIVFISVFFIFFLLLRSPIDHDNEEGKGSASSIRSLHRYQDEAVKSAHHQTLLNDRLENPPLAYHETQNEQDKLQDDSQLGMFVKEEEEEIPPTIHYSHKTVLERETEVLGASENNDDTSQVSAYIFPSSSAITTTTNIRNPMQKARWSFETWGSHPLPPKSLFTDRPGARWIAFFHEQTVAPVLLSNNATMFDCTVQEVIEKWEQRKALEYLGEVMPLQPVELPLMLHLITLCSVLNTPSPASRPAAATNINLLSQGLSVLQGILPGTLWCGRSDQADTFRHLGFRAALDSCCRTHDHCPVKLVPMTAHYGLANFSLKTRSHCLCDMEFYRCLKAASKSDPLATTVGEVYFNLLKLDCLSPASANPSHVADNVPSTTNQTPSQIKQSYPLRSTEASIHRLTPRMECSRRDSNGECRMWLINPRGFTARYHLTPSNLTF